MKEEGVGKIATICGRFYAMDRAKNWIRLSRAYEAIVFNRGEQASSPEEAIENAYKSNFTDEFIEPTVIYENGKPIAKLSEGDSVVFYNLRSDRARQFTKMFVANNKCSILSDNMPIIDKIKNLYFVAMTDFGPDLDVHTVLSSQKISATLPMAAGKLRQVYTAESEKYAHVTYFLNGGYADAVDGEDRIIVPSPIISSYDRAPEMSAGTLTENVLGYLKNDKYDFIVMNYANADMVGHTGNLEATVKAVEFIDNQLQKLAKEVLKRGGNLIVCADHGNADTMLDSKSEQVNTFHTKNPVPFLIASEKFKRKKISSGGVLGNIAPTILEILELDKPKAMNRESLLV
jgi:2,3-bisphosphoglycerate-independent phosphoglycerate mutase